MAIHATEECGGFTTEPAPGYRFGLDKLKVAALLRKIADGIEGERIGVTSLTQTDKAPQDDFHATILAIELVTVEPPAS